ncbi:MAG TPA: hypothetical protein VLH08_06865, partial [Acidobacteriota bacterium]|nr:hypothetical protein [Acidobacteriota bacterium]
RIPDFQMVFRPTVELSELDLGELISRDSELDAMFAKMQETSGNGDDPEKIRLSKEEGEVFQFIDGSCTVNDIIESSKLGEFHTCKALYELLERKLIEPVRKDLPIQIKEPTLTFTRLEEERTFNFAIFYPVLALGVLALLFYSFRDPLQLPGIRFFGGENQTQIRKAFSQNRMNVIDSALTLFFHTENRLPQKLDELVQSNYISKEDLRDAWHRPFLYQANASGYILAAQTEDGRVDESLQISRIFNSNVDVPTETGPITEVSTTNN